MEELNEQNWKRGDTEKLTLPPNKSIESYFTFVILSIKKGGGNCV